MFRSSLKPKNTQKRTVAAENSLERITNSPRVKEAEEKTRERSAVGSPASVGQSVKDEESLENNVDMESS